MHPLKNRRLQGRGFIELLPLEDPKRFANHFPFIGVASRENQSIDKLAERWRKCDGHTCEDTDAPTDCRARIALHTPSTRHQTVRPAPLSMPPSPSLGASGRVGGQSSLEGFAIPYHWMVLSAHPVARGERGLSVAQLACLCQEMLHDLRTIAAFTESPPPSLPSAEAGRRAFRFGSASARPLRSRGFRRESRSHGRRLRPRSRRARSPDAR